MEGGEGKEGVGNVGRGKGDGKVGGGCWVVVQKKGGVFVFGPVEGIINQGWPQPAVNHCVCVCVCALG